MYFPKRLVLFFISLFFMYTSFAVQNQLICKQCHKAIHGRYLKASNGDVFCSKKCFKAYLAKKVPRCAICHKPCYKGYKKNGKYYCSKKCMATTFPVCHRCHRHVQKGVVIGPNKVFFCKKCATKPRCFACSLPMPGNYLKDHRFICKQCQKTAIMDEATAKEIFTKVRARISKELGFTTVHKIRFQLVSQDKLSHASLTHGGGRELGLFIYEKNIVRTTKTLNGVSTTSERVKSENYTIYALYGLPKKKFIEVVAHELGHDWMQAYFPKIKALKIKEGWAEFFASQANILYGQKEMNRRMQNNKNPIYGNGYRFINAIARRKGINGVITLFKQLSK